LMRIRILIRIRIEVKSQIHIRIKVKRRISIRIKEEPSNWITPPLDIKSVMFSVKLSTRLHYLIAMISTFCIK
jgi:hypothetical protein